MSVILNPPLKMNPPTLNLDETEDYYSLVNDIGILNETLLKEKVRRVMEDNEFRHYDPINVFDYLNSKNDGWLLYGVREIDATKWADIKVKTINGLETTISKKLYSRAIPINVLKKFSYLRMLTVIFIFISMIIQTELL